MHHQKTTHHRAVVTVLRHRLWALRRAQEVTRSRGQVLSAKLAAAVVSLHAAEATIAALHTRLVSMGHGDDALIVENARLVAVVDTTARQLVVAHQDLADSIHTLVLVCGQIASLDKWILDSSSDADLLATLWARWGLGRPTPPLAPPPV